MGHPGWRWEIRLATPRRRSDAATTRGEAAAGPSVLTFGFFIVTVTSIFIRPLHFHCFSVSFHGHLSAFRAASPGPSRTCPPPPAGGRRTSAGRRRRATPPPDRPTHRYTGRCLTRHRVTVCNHDATHGWDGKQPKSAKIDHQIYISLCTWRLSASNVSRFVCT